MQVLTRTVGGVAAGMTRRGHRDVTHRTTRSRQCVEAWLRPIPGRPAYYDLLSRSEVERRMVKEWKILTEQDEERAPKPPMTPESKLKFFYGFFLFCVIPLSIRYTWFRFWKSVRRFLLYPIQKKWALLDARVDGCLSWMGGNGFQFSRRMVSLRLHKKIGPGRELRYRVGLLRGEDVEHCTMFIDPRPLHNEASNASRPQHA